MQTDFIDGQRIKVRYFFFLFPSISFRWSFFMHIQIGTMQETINKHIVLKQYTNWMIHHFDIHLTMDRIKINPIRNFDKLDSSSQRPSSSCCHGGKHLDCWMFSNCSSHSVCTWAHYVWNSQNENCRWLWPQSKTLSTLIVKSNLLIQLIQNKTKQNNNKITKLNALLLFEPEMVYHTFFRFDSLTYYL